jgi:tetratricopeptide (TPR) repeat protein
MKYLRILKFSISTWDLIPNKNQWKRWTRPNKYTAMGLIIGIVSLMFSIIVWATSINDKKINQKQINALVEQIKQIQPQGVSESLKKNISAVAAKLSNPKTAEDFFLKAFAAQMENQYDSAIENYENAIELKFEDIDDVYNNMGVAYAQKGDFDKAIESFEKSIEFKNNNAVAYHNIGLIFSQKGYVEKALELFEQALVFDPEYAEVFNSIGSIYFKKGNYHKAIEFIEKAIEFRPEEYTVNYHDNLGLAYLKNKNYNKAIECFKKAIEFNPNDSEAYLNMGNAYLDGKRDFYNAIKCYEKAIDIKPGYADAIYNIGVATRLLIQVK